MHKENSVLGFQIYLLLNIIKQVETVYVIISAVNNDTRIDGQSCHNSSLYSIAHESNPSMALHSHGGQQATCAGKATRGIRLVRHLVLVEPTPVTHKWSAERP